MTPFDPIALLAMLRAFYPEATVANLRRAREERPEYFAGGALFGSKGEKLRLPDGRVFDLIFATGTSQARWQVLEDTGGGGGGGGWPLENGPLTPIDPQRFPVMVSDPIFVSLAAGRLAELHTTEEAIGAREARMLEAADPGALDDELRAHAGAGERTLEAHISAFEDLNPAALARSSDGMVGRIDDTQGRYPTPGEGEPDEIGETEEHGKLPRRRIPGGRIPIDV